MHHQPVPRDASTEDPHGIPQRQRNIQSRREDVAPSEYPRGISRRPCNLPSEYPRGIPRRGRGGPPRPAGPRRGRPTRCINDVSIERSQSPWPPDPRATGKYQLRTRFTAHRGRAAAATSRSSARRTTERRCRLALAATPRLRRLALGISHPAAAAPRRRHGDARGRGGAAETKRRGARSRRRRGWATAPSGADRGPAAGCRVDSPRPDRPSSSGDAAGSRGAAETRGAAAAPLLRRRFTAASPPLHRRFRAGDAVAALRR